MPQQPQARAVIPICKAVDGAPWVRYDEAHSLLFVGRARPDGWWVHTIDIITGEPWDQPWPVPPNHVVIMGYRAAFEAAVTERVNRGY